MPGTHDLIVIGGGPAGSAAARRAVQLGSHTLLVEKQRFPRYKPCGGALSEHAMSCLDFEIPRCIQERDIFGARVHFAGHAGQQRRRNRIATLVTRSRLDDYLLQEAREAGAEMRMGEKVVLVHENPTQVEVRTSDSIYQARAVIIAEGAHGKLKHAVRRPDRPSEYGVCVVTEIEERNEVIERYLHDAIELHFGIARGGYGWVFPHDGHYSVGVGGLAAALPDPKRTMRFFLQSRGFEGQHRLSVHVVPIGGVTRRVARSRILLAGDAAGFVDPFLGEGMAYAIRSGQLAAEVAHRYLVRRDEPSRVREYSSRCEREFGQNLRYSLVLSRLMHRFPRVFFEILAGHDDALARFLEVAAAERTYKSYLAWLLRRLPRYLALRCCG
jgi:geranylgeranyl reductase family protein